MHLRNNNLFMAIRTNNPPLIPDLIQYVKLNEKLNNGKTAMQFAYELRRWDCIREIAKHQATDENDTAGYGEILLAALGAGYDTVAEALLEAKASLSCSDETGNSALHLVVWQKKSFLIGPLLRFGADLTLKDYKDRTPISIAIGLKYWEGIKEIARNKKTDKADAAGYGHALYAAVMDDRSDVIELLLKAGTSPSWQDPKSGNYLLHAAIKKSAPAIVALLLYYGADLTLTNVSGETPLQLASWLGQVKSVEAIVKHPKVDKSEAVGYGYALYLAGHRNRLDIVELLLQAGASPMWQDSGGNQLLHIAAKMEVYDSNIVALALSYGADLSAKNKNGYTPLQLADDAKNSVIDDGWKKYFIPNHLSVINFLTVLVQSERQPRSRFYNYPLPLLDLFLSFLGRDDFAAKKTIKSRKECINKMSLNCFTESFSSIRMVASKAHVPFFTHLGTLIKDGVNTEAKMMEAINTYYDDKESAEVEAIVEEVLNTHSRSQKSEEREKMHSKEEMAKLISAYMGDKKEEKREAMDLLRKYKLISIGPSHLQGEKKSMTFFQQTANSLPHTRTESQDDSLSPSKRSTLSFEHSS